MIYAESSPYSLIPNLLHAMLVFLNILKLNHSGHPIPKSHESQAVLGHMHVKVVYTRSCFQIRLECDFTYRCFFGG